MEKIRTINSYVAIELPYITKSEVDFLDGKIELMQNSHTREKQMSCSYGTILAMPETDTDIHNHFTFADNSMMVGDKAFFDKGYTSVHGRLTKRAEKDSFNLLFEEDGRIVILVPSRAIIMVKRGDEYIAQNDYIIGTLVDQPKSAFDIYDKKYGDRLKVVSSGNNVRYKKITKGIDTDFKVEAGDIAIAAGGDIVLRISDEYEKHDLYLLKQRQVIGTISHK
jgi:hypothetical protein